MLICSSLHYVDDTNIQPTCPEVQSSDHSCLEKSNENAEKISLFNGEGLEFKCTEVSP